MFTLHNIAYIFQITLLKHNATAYYNKNEDVATIIAANVGYKKPIYKKSRFSLKLKRLV